MDVSDELSATLELLDLHADAARAGITIAVGLGVGPGITNILARYGADRRDRVEEVHTSWIRRASDMGGRALAMHLLYSNAHRAFDFADAAMREVRPFEDGRETIDDPVLGPVEVTQIGHSNPRPVALPPGTSGMRTTRPRILPMQVNDLLKELGRVARSGHPVMVEGRPVDRMAFAASSVQQSAAPGGRIADRRAAHRGAGGTGRPAGAPRRCLRGRIGIGTGVPASIGAMLLAIGKIDKPGVWPPEACIDLGVVPVRHRAAAHRQYRGTGVRLGPAGEPSAVSR